MVLRPHETLTIQCPIHTQMTFNSSFKLILSHNAVLNALQKLNNIHARQQTLHKRHAEPLR